MLKSSLCADDAGTFAENLSNAEIEQIINRNSDMVYRLAFAKVGNRADADDIYQQVFLRYLKRRPDFANANHEKAWFLRVTANCTKSWWNLAYRRHCQAVEGDIAADTKEELDLLPYLLQLPKDYRTVLHLFYYEDLTTAEIAQILQRKENTVRMQLTRARRRLKEILKGAEDVEF